MRVTIRVGGCRIFFPHHVATLPLPPTRESALCNGAGPSNRVARSETRPAIILGFNTQLSVTWHSGRGDGRRKEEGSPLLRKKGGGEGVKRNRQRGGWRVTTGWLPQDERCPLDWCATLSPSILAPLYPGY